MNRTLVDRIAEAVLYEGYILYPYRPSVKNQQRWTFGGLYPEAYCRTGNGESARNRTECLVQGDTATKVEVFIRFLHLAERVENALAQPWQGAEAREVALDETTLGALARRPQRVAFTFAGGRRTDGACVREQQSLAGDLEAQAVEVAEGLYRLTVCVVNRTPLTDTNDISRDTALLHALVSAHTILGVEGGAFVSLFDPPEDRREHAAACRNVGVWPVLVGDEGQTDTMLASPIILYDYPQIAPESPGDFFDATEIDEMLTLRILTLTDDEKRAMATVDDRTRALLARTEALAREQMLGLHGTMRRPKEGVHG